MPLLEREGKRVRVCERETVFVEVREEREERDEREEGERLKERARSFAKQLGLCELTYF
jgi:hypothetical protein